LARDLGYIDIDTFNELEAKANKAGTFISAYSNGVLNNNGIKD
jgi:hypothetical protein